MECRKKPGKGKPGKNQENIKNGNFFNGDFPRKKPNLRAFLLRFHCIV